jgi:excisionase family DNA binding protein
VKYLSPEQIAEQLGVSRATGYRIAHSCLFVRVGKLIRIPEDALVRYLAQRTSEPDTWEPSISDTKAVRTTGTGPTPRTGTIGKRSALATRRSREPDSGNSSWYRPIQQRTRGMR